MAHTGVTAVPRVLTSAELVNSFIPFFTVPAAYQLVNVMLLFTDQHFKLFALVATLCFLLYLSEWGLEWLFKLNDGKVDRLERVYLYCILLVRFFFFFMLAPILIAGLTWLFGRPDALPAWYHALTLFFSVLLLFLAFLPTVVSHVAHATVAATGAVFSS